MAPRRMPSPVAEMKMCSISVAPMPSVMASPVAACHASRVASGSASPADTDKRRLRKSCCAARGAIWR
ncbi:hypothetical protein D3C85_213980 [compost metagenome]